MSEKPQTTVSAKPDKRASTKPEPGSHPDRPNTRLDSVARMGMLACMVMLVSVFGWMQFTFITGAVIASGQVMVRGDLSMDPLRHAVMWKGKDVSLTVTEFLLLQALAQRPGFVKSRDQLMDVAYDDQVYVDDRTIDSHIKRLRKKMRTADDNFSAIETLYGIGYRYNEE